MKIEIETATNGYVLRTVKGLDVAKTLGRLVGSGFDVGKALAGEPDDVQVMNDFDALVAALRAKLGGKA